MWTQNIDNTKNYLLQGKLIEFKSIGQSYFEKIKDTVHLARR